MKKVQKVCRTYSSYGRKDNIAELAELLRDGYVVVMCSLLGNDLEYIVEKEVEDSDHKHCLEQI